MNDFTKDELEYLYEALWELMKLGWNKTDLNYCKKIQSMIDNYCNHANYISPLYNNSGDLSGIGLCYDCHKGVGKGVIGE